MASFRETHAQDKSTDLLASPTSLNCGRGSLALSLCFRSDFRSQSSLASRLVLEGLGVTLITKLSLKTKPKVLFISNLI